MKTFVILTLFIIGILSGFIGFSSDIAGLTNYNIVEIIKNNDPYSYFILGLIIIIMYLIAYIKMIRDRKNENPVETNSANNPKENSLSTSDILILDHIFDIFSGTEMYNFFDYLADTRSVNINQITKYDEGIKLFLSPHKRLRNQLLEKAKVEFLTAFENFLTYSTSFDSNNGLTARFKAKSKEEEVSYLKIVNEIYEEWSKFLDAVAKEAPNYHIKD
ncbi:hypothetical protein P2R64_01685 [Priestia megaterium]|uniref:hypothetical protein n=1 Tax=Priestia megaterium TaxID=1404 RepID=UPI0021C0FF6F|nr:hypothetical protein [Priestia megaterium]MCT9853680.1 hypothetical protein [Priestia megaterium]MDF1958774.1 hypothetical protein [Priestia megaterium]